MQILTAIIARHDEQLYFGVGLGNIVTAVATIMRLSAVLMAVTLSASLRKWGGWHKYHLRNVPCGDNRESGCIVPDFLLRRFRFSFLVGCVADFRDF